MINNFQQAVAYKLETSEKIDLTKKKRKEKKTQIEILDQKNVITEISQWLCSTTEWK